MTKPTLYRFELSVWSAAADIARVELGLTDVVEVEQVSVLNAENLHPDFLKKTPNGTLPAVVDGESVYGNTTEVVEYFIKKSGKTLAPRTKVTEIVHADGVDPNFILVAAKSDEEATKQAGGLAGFFVNTRLGKIKELFSHPHAGPHQETLKAKADAFAGLSDVYSGKATPEAKAGFYTASQANHDAVGVLLYETLPPLIKGPFVAGAEPGEDDFHVIAWVTRVAFASGAETSDVAISVLEKRYGKPLPEKVKAFFEAWSVRPGFKATYPDGKIH